MLRLLGSLCVASGGVLAWYVQRAERRRERDARSDLLRAFRRMGEEVRMARTPLPALLSALAADCGEPAAAFFQAVSRAAAGGHGHRRYGAADKSGLAGQAAGTVDCGRRSGGSYHTG